MEKIDLADAVNQLQNAAKQVKTALKTANLAVNVYDRQMIINQFDDEFGQLAGYLQWLIDTGGDNAFE